MSRACATPPRRFRGEAAFAAVLLATIAVVAPSPTNAETRGLEIEASDIPVFDPARPDGDLGALRYVGGFVYTSSDSRLRGVSGLRLRADRARFLAVTDTGYWFEGAIDRDGDGRPTGLSGARMAPILGPDGEARTRRKGLADAEGLAIDGDRALVSFERSHRIESFDITGGPAGGDPMESIPSEVAHPIPLTELRSNAGIEAIAVAPSGSPTAGRTVIVTEQSIDTEGNLFAAILGQESGDGVFKVRREVPWHVTDGAYTPAGDLLLLERRYQSFGRIGMRIRRISGEAIRPGALVDGDVLLDADFGQEIDNMEGLDISVGSDGETYVTLVSDDNGNFLQRNLFLEFRLADEGTQTGSVLPD